MSKGSDNYYDGPHALKDATNQCGNSSRPQYKNLDDHIKMLEEQVKDKEDFIERVKEDISHLNLQISEMKKVRKLVTPKDEARIQQLRNIGLI